MHNSLKTFDFAVANPPFSDKAWSNGLNPAHDEYRRFVYGIPPPRNGDYAFLLHLIASLKSKGKGAIILPHGVLFRGNKEADIRRNLIQRGFIRGIIGLPANLFYGTGIPACILVIDKENAHIRTGIFMMDASKGFLKDGNKNRLRAQDIHKIVDVFNKQTEVSRYSRMVPMAEVTSLANDYNLNIPRYIDSSEPEDLHDLDAHLKGGIPDRDIDALSAYWTIFPSLRQKLFQGNGQAGYSELRILTQQVNIAILSHGEFKSYSLRVSSIFDGWCDAHEPLLQGLEMGVDPKKIIHTLSQDLLCRFADLPLLSHYDVYQQLMDCWEEAIQDDMYIIASEGWQVGRVLRSAADNEIPDFTIKKGRRTFKYIGELVPASLVIARFFGNSQRKLERLEAEVTKSSRRKEEYEEEHGTDEGALTGLEGKSGITKSNVQQRAMELKEAILTAYPEGTAEHDQAKSIKKTTFGNSHWTKNIRDDDGLFEELDILYDYLQIIKNESDRKKEHKQALGTHYKAVIAKYDKLTETQIKTMVVEDKWFASIRVAIEGEVQRLTRQFAGRIKVLEERYTRTLLELERDVETLGAKVEEHLRKMGVVWE